MKGTNGPAMAWAVRVPGLSAQRKLVLVAVAEYAGKDGRCWPALGTVAGHLGVHVGTVRRHVDALVRAGLLLRERRHRNADGTLGVWVYRVLCPVDNAVDQRAQLRAVDQRAPGRESPGDQRAQLRARGTRSNGTGSTRASAEHEVTATGPAVDNAPGRATQGTTAYAPPDASAVFARDRAGAALAWRPPARCPRCGRHYPPAGSSASSLWCDCVDL